MFSYTQRSNGRKMNTENKVHIPTALQVIFNTEQGNQRSPQKAPPTSCLKLPSSRLVIMIKSGEKSKVKIPDGITHYSNTVYYIYILCNIYIYTHTYICVYIYICNTKLQLTYTFDQHIKSLSPKIHNNTLVNNLKINLSLTFMAHV